MRLVSSPRPSTDSDRPSERDMEEARMNTSTSRRDGYQLLSPDGVSYIIYPPCIRLHCPPACNGSQICRQLCFIPHIIPVLPPHSCHTTPCLAARPFAYVDNSASKAVPQTTNNAAPCPAWRYLLGNSKSSRMFIG